MRSSMAALIVLWAANVSPLAALPSVGHPDAPPKGRSGQSFDWNPWRRLPVQDGGRHKPLDTLARETVQKISGRTSFADPETGEKLGPVALYLTMWLDWRAAEKPPSPHGMAMIRAQMAYLQSHQADRWDRAALMPVDPLLREPLGIDKDQERISPLELSQAQVEDPEGGETISFSLWALRLARTEGRKLSDVEQAGLSLADRLWCYQGLRTGEALEVLPVKDSPDRQWLSVASLMRSDFDDQTDPTGGLRKVKRQLQKARAAYRDGSPEAFDQASAALIAEAGEVGPQLGPYPRQTIIDLEVAYNRWAPFRLAWVLTLAAALCLLLSMAARRRPFYVVGLAALGASVLAMLVGFWMRSVISGWAPVTNLYESVVCMALGTVVFGLIFGLRSGKQYVFAAAAVVATIALVLADHCPSVLNPSIHPLPPVLRSRFWLAVHVTTIVLSYGAFALALGIGNITLGYYLVGSKRLEAIRAQCRFIYQSFQAGVLLLVAGTILGALWADYSWGRFWGWDPKEVWALITLLGYLAVLHGRYAGWVDNLGLAVLSVVCFTPVLVTWYVVNYMGAGLHDYGFSGNTGLFYVCGAVGAELLYVGATLLAVFIRSLFTPSGGLSPQLAGRATPRTETATS
jgi:ABC-type transport system involved in cytochrome c biogenesis permease subunit